MVQGVLEEWLGSIPDEFTSEVEGWRREIEGCVQATNRRVALAFADAPRGSRKEFALWVQASHPADAPYLFALLDGRDIAPMIFKREF
jgi:hypothetical protein